MDFPKSTIITQELIDAALEQLNNEEEQNGLAIIAIQQRLIDALKNKFIGMNIEMNDTQIKNFVKYLSKIHGHKNFGEFTDQELKEAYDHINGSSKKRKKTKKKKRKRRKISKKSRRKGRKSKRRN